MKSTRFLFLSQVFRSHTYSICVRLSHPHPRIGLVAEGNPHVPLGFIFCDVGIVLTQLHCEIARQLPVLYRALVAMGYGLLDCNGWPIGQEQEAMFSLAEVVVERTVKLRLHSRSRQPLESLTSAANQTTALPPPSHPLALTTIPSDPAYNLRTIVEESADLGELSLLQQSLSSSDAYDSAMAPGTSPGRCCCSLSFSPSLAFSSYLFALPSQMPSYSPPSPLSPTLPSSSSPSLPLSPSLSRHHAI